jgi:hypothetical protein
MFGQNYKRSIEFFFFLYFLVEMKTRVNLVIKGNIDRRGVEFGKSVQGLG